VFSTALFIFCFNWGLTQRWQLVLPAQYWCVDVRGVCVFTTCWLNNTSRVSRNQQTVFFAIILPSILTQVATACGHVFVTAAIAVYDSVVAGWASQAATPSGVCSACTV
jgi:hypothetical protein